MIYHCELCTLSMYSPGSAVVAENLNGLDGYLHHEDIRLFYLFIYLFIYFIAKSYTYQKYGIQHRYTIII